MEKYVIKGGTPLDGEVTIAGAKNAALLAIQMLALSDEGLAEKLEKAKADMIDGVKAKDAALQEKLAAL